MKSVCKIFFAFACVCFCAFPVFSQPGPEKYSLIRAWFSPEFTLRDADNAGLETDHAVIKENYYIETVATETTIELLKTKNVKTEIVIANLSEFYRNRALLDQKFLKDFKNDRTLSGKNIPVNFTFGSMGGFYTLNEIYAVFASMREKFPDLVSLPEKIGKSVEGRDIFAYRISTPVYTNAKLEVLYTAVHHAREPGGVTVLTYFLWDILERFKTGDQEAQYLLKYRELYIIPMINPDGYAYNEQVEPNGGGLWRKNRRRIDQDSWGIDLNRNYGPQDSWDAPVDGSSTNPDFDNYRGTAPFSEPETRAVRDFCRAHAFKNALNYHSFGGLLIYPFATKQRETPDSATYRGMAAEFIRENKYAAGTGLQTVGYSVRGDSDEWMYFAEAQKKKIFAMTPEVGTVIDRFWPEPSRIIPQAQENLSMNYQLAWSAGVNIRPQHIDSDESRITIRLSNIGLLPSLDSVEVSAISLDPLVSLGAPFKKLAPLGNRAEDEISFPYSVTQSFKNGTDVKIVVTVLQQGVPRSDTMTIRVLKKTVTPLFDGTDSGFWSTGISWDIITDHYGVTAFTDSPDGIYEDLQENYLSYDKTVHLGSVNSASLRFKTRWSIESKADFAVVQVSQDNGASWKTLQTSRMKRGLGLSGTKQKQGEYGFDGNFPEWTEQQASLEEYLGKDIRIRFGLLTDVGGNFDGWYLSDIDLITFEKTGTDITEENLLKEPLKLFPNPAFKNSEIVVTSPFTDDLPVEIVVSDMHGKTVFKSESFFKNNSARIPLRGFPAGTYQVVLRQNSKEVSASFVVQ